MDTLAGVLFAVIGALTALLGVAIKFAVKPKNGVKKEIATEHFRAGDMERSYYDAIFGRMQDSLNKIDRKMSVLMASKNLRDEDD